MIYVHITLFKMFKMSIFGNVVLDSSLVMEWCTHFALIGFVPILVLIVLNLKHVQFSACIGV